MSYSPARGRGIGHILFCKIPKLVGSSTVKQHGNTTFNIFLVQEERKAYEVAIENGRLYYKQSRKLVETCGYAKWIFVLSTSNTLYVGQKIKGKFQHSSFLAGGATLSAGRLAVEGGVIKVSGID